MLLCLSLSCQQAPLEVREPFAFLPEELPDLGAFLSPYVAEAFVLSTCQRFEVCVIPKTAIPAECLARLFAEFRQVDATGICSHLRAYRDQDAAEHIFRVAAGLESQVLGEAQILGQMRRALEAARGAGLIGHRLGTLIQQAITAGRRVREETGLARGALSVPQVAVNQARRHLGDLTAHTAVLVGAGETGRLAAKALEGAGRLFILNRTPARAESLAREVGGTALPWSALPTALNRADLIVCCTGARSPIITRRMVSALQTQREQRPLLLVDLSVPRGIEADVSDVAGTRVITLEHVREQSAANHEDRRQEIPRAEMIVGEDLRRAWRAWESADAQYAIVALRERAEEVRRSELDKALRRLPSLCPEHGEMVDYLTRAIVNKLLHQPTVWLRTHPDAADTALQEVFGIERAV